MSGDAAAVQVSENWKCSGCRELPEGKVLQCPDGHILCDQCFSTTRPCPDCGKPIPCEIRNTALEEMLEQVGLECEHKWNGCEMKVGRKEIRAHVETCIFRQLVPLCSQMGLDCHYQIPRNNVQSVVEHFSENHTFQEAPLGTPVSYFLQDFQEAATKLSARKSIWPPLLLKSTMGPTLTPLYSVVLVSAIPSSSSSSDSNSSLSVAAISLTDFFPVGGPYEVKPRAQFSIKCDSGRVATLSNSVPPFPSMNCKELLSASPYRFPVSLLLSRYSSPDGSLKIECTLTDHVEMVASEEGIFSILVERIPGGENNNDNNNGVGGVAGEEDNLVQQLLRPVTSSNESPAGSRGRANGRGATRGRRSTRARGMNVLPRDV